MHVITKREDFCEDKLRVIVPYNINGKSYFDIFYDGKHPLLIQTPLCTLSYKFSIYDDKYFKVDLALEDNEKVRSEFTEMINYIQDLVLSKVRKKYNYLFDGKECVYGITSGKCKLVNTNVDTVKAFNIDNKCIDIRNVQPKDQVRALFQIDKLVVSEQSYSFTFRVMQLKKYSKVDLFNVGCLFQDIGGGNSCVQGGDDEKFDKFRKMMKMGVPLQAVQHKMKMEGFTESEIAQFGMVKRPPPPPPPPPPLFSFHGNNGNAGGLNENKTGGLPFLGDISKGNFQLKSVVENQKSESERIKQKIMKFVDKTKFAPSLQDILDAKASLGKRRIRK